MKRLFSIILLSHFVTSHTTCNKPLHCMLNKYLPYISTCAYTAFITTATAYAYITMPPKNLLTSELLMEYAIDQEINSKNKK